MKPNPQRTFVFVTDARESCSPLDFVARIPRNICSRDDLFSALEKTLHLPWYFGRNWDALDECLRDLSWISQRRVVIVHQDLPCMDPQTLTTYLDVLLYCINDWGPEEEHELTVTFPTESLAQVMELIQ